VNVQPERLDSHESAVVSQLAALAVLAFWRAISAAATTPAISAANRRYRLSELLLPALRRGGARRLDVVRRRLDLLIRRVVSEASHPSEDDGEGLLVELLATSEILL
jgi:hypothetical protein